MAIQAIIALTALCGFVGLWDVWQRYFNGSDRHCIADIDINIDLPQGLDFSASRPHHEWYASQNTEGFCTAHGYSVFTPQAESGQRKVYDLVMVNTEMDFLEIRLATMYDYVDYFIIVESSRTFQGSPKKLAIRDNWAKFGKYQDKIIYHELQYPEGFSPRVAWDYEDLQRNAMYDQVFPRLTGEKVPIAGDVLIVADVDEIVRPVTLLLLRSCNFPRRLTLASKFYYYSFQYLHSGPEWQHPQATYYEGNGTLLPVNLRNGDGGVPLLRGVDKGVLGNAAWHCSNCLATVGEFLNKMASFSHVWMNHRYFRDRDRIAEAVRHGRDVWGRRQDTFVRIEGNEDVPAFIREQGDRFRYMLSRDGETAGFTDYP